MKHQARSRQHSDSNPGAVIVNRRPEELKPWPGNPRIHGAKQLFKGAEEPEGTEPDDLQEDDIAVEVVSLPGDPWNLGPHRLLCGDALKVDAYKAVMQGDKAEIVISDPAYNVPIAGHVGGKGKIKHRDFAMAAG